LRKKLFLLFIFGGLVIVSDQLSKILIRFHGGFYFCNPHIALGIKIPAVFFWIFWTSIILLCLYVLYKKYPAWESFCLILIFSGALSNLIDRILEGCVIDFINLGFGPVFNLADFFIILGAIMLTVIRLKIKR